jgi:hypothetical protein
VIEHEWDQEEPVEEAVVLPVAKQPIKAARTPVEPCVVFDPDYLHWREQGSVFTLCGQRSAQGLQGDDKRLLLPECPLCSSVAEGGDGS